MDGCEGCRELGRLLVAMERERDDAVRAAAHAAGRVEEVTASYMNLRGQTGGQAAEITALHQRLVELPMAAADALEREAKAVDPQQTAYLTDIYRDAARKVRGVAG